MMTIKKLREILFSMKKYYIGPGIYIYQMGKVGSSSIESLLNQKGHSAVHLHHFFDNKNKQFNYDILNSSIIYKIKTYIIGLIKFIGFFINRYLRQNKIKIITLVRDPVSRNISAMFQNLHEFIYEHNIKDSRKEESFYSMLDEIFKTKINHNLALEWYDNELKKFTGIDIFEYDFPKDKGVMIIKEKNIEIMVIKLEKINTAKKEIRKFIGLEEVSIQKTNSSNNKWYKQFYVEYKEKFKPGKFYLNQMYDNDVIRYFYSEDEIKSFYDKWE